MSPGSVRSAGVRVQYGYDPNRKRTCDDNVQVIVTGILELLKSWWPSHSLLSTLIFP